jgi:hypothetical protein
MSDEVMNSDASQQAVPPGQLHEATPVDEPSILMAPLPEPENGGALNPPTGVSPPVPATLPDVPQVRQGKSSLLNRLQGASLFPWSKKGLARTSTEPPKTEQKESAGKNTSQRILPVDFQSEKPKGESTNHAIFRFDEVPEAE